MKDTFLDVEVAVPSASLADNLYTTELKDELSAQLVEKCRVEAEQRAREVGGRVRTDRAPEFYIRTGGDLVTGEEFLLVASRWSVVVPNAFDMTRVGR
jgi:hypothetical protein